MVNMSTLVPVESLKVLAIGEVLWDVVGEKNHLGGAPFNFACHARALGAQAAIITRVGNDDLGIAILQRAAELGLPPSYIQRDTVRPTSTVPVTLDATGSACYEILNEVAWDYLEFNDLDRKAVDNADVLCFGSLGQRSPIGRSSINAALASVKPNCLVVMDLNLRAPHYDEHVISSSLQRTDMLKLNEAELAVLQSLYGLPAGDTQSVTALAQRFNIATVVVTRGVHGADAWSLDAHEHVDGIPIKVQDTIGSGDAFTAVFALDLAAGNTLAGALRAANVAGAYVATQPGGTPPISTQLLREFEISPRPHPERQA